MLEILKFVLSDFWVFCGTVVLIYISGESVSMIVAAAFGKGVSYSLINTGGKAKEDSKEGKGSAVQTTLQEVPEKISENEESR